MDTIPWVLHLHAAQLWASFSTLCASVSSSIFGAHNTACLPQKIVVRIKQIHTCEVPRTVPGTLNVQEVPVLLLIIIVPYLLMTDSCTCSLSWADWNVSFPLDRLSQSTHLQHGKPGTHHFHILICQNSLSWRRVSLTHPCYQLHIPPSSSPTSKPLGKLRAFYFLNFSGLSIIFCPLSIYSHCSALFQATRPPPFNPSSSISAVTF